ncbi:unnamed protein product [Urochloa humidicola]
MPALNGCGLSGSMRSTAGGDAAGEGVIPGVNCGETGQLGEPDGRDGDQRMEPDCRCRCRRHTVHRADH